MNNNICNYQANFVNKYKNNLFISINGFNWKNFEMEESIIIY